MIIRERVVADNEGMQCCLASSLEVEVTRMFDPRFDGDSTTISAWTLYAFCFEVIFEVVSRSDTLKKHLIRWPLAGLEKRRCRHSSNASLKGNEWLDLLERGKSGGKLRVRKASRIACSSLIDLKSILGRNWRQTK